MSVPRYTQIEIDALQAMGWTEEKIALHCRAMLQDAMGPDWDEFLRRKESLEREDALLTPEERQYFKECDEEDYLEYSNSHPFSYYVEVPYLCAEPFMRHGARVLESRFVPVLKSNGKKLFSRTSDHYLSGKVELPDKAAWRVFLVFDEIDTFYDTIDELSTGAPVFKGDEASAEAFLRWMYDLWTEKEFYASFFQWSYAVESAMALLESTDNKWYSQYMEDIQDLFYQTFKIHLFLHEWLDCETDIDGCVYTNGGRFLSEVFEGSFPSSSYSVAEGTQVISDWVLEDKASLTEISIPKSVRMVGMGFLSKTSVREVHFPAGIRDIGDFSLEECTSLKKVVFPDGVIALNYICENCPALEEVVLPSSLMFLDNAFLGQNNVFEADLPPTVSHTVIRTSNGIDQKTPVMDPTELEAYRKYEKLVDILYVGVAEDNDDESLEGEEIMVNMNLGADVVTGMFGVNSGVHIVSPVQFEYDPFVGDYTIRAHKRELIRQWLAYDYIKEHAEELRSEYDRILLKKAELESRFNEFFGSMPRVYREYHDLHDKAFKDVPYISRKLANVSNILGLEEISWFV